jgi:PTH2 family peptidyl-tRNA hydrolase
VTDHPPTEAKQVIVIRSRYPDGKGGTYKPRTGKLISQGAHASMAVFFNMGTIFEHQGPVLNGGFYCGMTPAMRAWYKGAFAKIVVKVESEEELLALAEKAKAAGLHHALIQDHGRTEFHGVPTLTCLAIGPAWPHEIDPITGHLELM